jgi:hypothetical protein
MMKHAISRGFALALAAVLVLFCAIAVVDTPASHASPDAVLDLALADSIDAVPDEPSRLDARSTVNYKPSFEASHARCTRPVMASVYVVYGTERALAVDPGGST